MASGQRANFKVYSGTGAAQNVILPAGVRKVEIFRKSNGEVATKLPSFAGNEYHRHAAGALSFVTTATEGITLADVDGQGVLGLEAACLFNASGAEYHAVFWF